MENPYTDIIDRGEAKFSQSRDLLKKLKRLKPKKLDDQIHALHEETFKRIDCLQCANCCKTTSPIFLMVDIERLSKALKMKPQNFIEAYLRIDADGDYVLQSTPCPFLDGDNYCLVYQYRPQACKEYPHTNRKRMHQILDLTLRNNTICPAVFTIVEKLGNTYK